LIPECYLPTKTYIMISTYLINLKNSHRPENKIFDGLPNERYSANMYENRRRTRPWDNCWFSNKPDVIVLTVEQAIRQYPDYMQWCYNNLEIKWSVHTIKLFKAHQPKQVLGRLTF